jgi:hypothetical protein
MQGTAPDILDLEKKLNDGEGDDVLSNRAIEIFERLTDEIKAAKAKGNKSQADFLVRQVKDFDRVLSEIKDRRHAHVLDKFTQHSKGKI